MKTLRLGNKIIITLLKDRLYYPAHLIAELLVSVARFGILVPIYWYVFQFNGGEINGIGFQAAAWSMFFYAILGTYNLKGIAREIERDIKVGSVEMLFSKPVSYLGYRMWWQLGRNLYSFLVLSTTGIVILSLFIGFPSIGNLLLFITTFIVTLILGSILTLLFYAVFGLLAFWIEDIEPMRRIMDKLMMILGGAFLPVALFPNFMYAIVLYTPFGAAFFLTHTVYPGWLTEWPLKLGIQALWILILFLLVSWLFTLARERVSVNGG